MKASEINVGEEVAVTSGTDSYSQTTLRATKARVEAKPKGGYVGITLLEDARWGLGRRKAGERFPILTRYLWMPWATIEVRAENERRKQEEKDVEEKAREDRLAGLQTRLDQFAGEVDESLDWGGLRHLDVTAYVRIPTPALEALLDRAER